MPPLRSLAVPVAALAALAVAAPASADVTGSTHSDDVVLYDHCQQHPISYNLTVGAFTLPWRVEVQVLDPDGRTSEGTVLNSADDPPLSGTTYQQFCGSETLGTWTVRNMIRYSPIDLTPNTVLNQSTFEVRPMAIQTSLGKKRLSQGRYRLKVRVEQQAEQGFERANGIPVRLEKASGGTWKKVKGLTLTTVKGRAFAVVTGRGSYRAVVTARDNHAESTSPVVKTG